MERLRKKLKSIHEATGQKVDVITHSMGGLLFKSFVALHYDDVAQYVNKWVAIAAPFRGMLAQTPSVPCLSGPSFAVCWHHTRVYHGHCISFCDLFVPVLGGGRFVRCLLY